MTEQNRSRIMNLPANLLPATEKFAKDLTEDLQNPNGRKKWFVLGFFVVVALVVVLVFGYKYKQQKSTPKSTVTRQELDFRTLPANFPANLPLNEKASPVLANYLMTLDSGEAHELRKWVVSNNFDEVVKVYTDYFLGNGWTVTQNRKVGETQVFSAFNSSVSARISVSSGSEKTQSVIEAEVVPISK